MQVTLTDRQQKVLDRLNKSGFVQFEWTPEMLGLMAEQQQAKVSAFKNKFMFRKGKKNV